MARLKARLNGYSELEKYTEGFPLGQSYFLLTKDTQNHIKERNVAISGIVERVTSAALSEGDDGGYNFENGVDVIYNNIDKNYYITKVPYIDPEKFNPQDHTKEEFFKVEPELVTFLNSKGEEVTKLNFRLTEEATAAYKGWESSTPSFEDENEHS